VFDSSCFSTVYKIVSHTDASCCTDMFRLSRDALRAAYVAPSSSSSLAHGSSGPMSLQLPMYRSQHPPQEPTPVTGLLGGQQPTSNLSAPVYGVPVHVAYKRPAMLSSEYGHSSGRRALMEPLKIDTELKKVLTSIHFCGFLKFFIHFYAVRVRTILVIGYWAIFTGIG